VKGRKARGAAERGHGQDAPVSTPARVVSGAGGWRTAALARRWVSWAVARRWCAEFDRLCVSTDPGFANPGVGVRVAACNRDGWAPGGARSTGLRLPACVDAIDRTPEPCWRELWRVRIPGEHRRAVSAWPGQEIVAERTPGGSKASKWACRPLTGEPSVGGKGTVRAARSPSASRRPA